LPSSDTSKAPSRETATPTGRPHTSELPITKPDDLPLVEDVLDEGDRLRFHPQQVRIDLAAGQDDCIIVGSRNLA